MIVASSAFVDVSTLTLQLDLFSTLALWSTFARRGYETKGFRTWALILIDELEARHEPLYPVVLGQRGSHDGHVTS